PDVRATARRRRPVTVFILGLLTVLALRHDLADAIAPDTVLAARPLARVADAHVERARGPVVTGLDLARLVALRGCSSAALTGSASATSWRAGSSAAGS